MRRWLIIPVALLVALATVPMLLAQTSQPVSNPIHRTVTDVADGTGQQSSSFSNYDISRVAMSLAAVLCLILVLRFLIRRIAPSATGRSSRGIRVVTRAYLGPKQQVMVLQVGRRVLVVGDSGQNLSTLCEITDPDEAAMLLAQIQGKSSELPQNSFADAMRRASNSFSPNDSNNASDPALSSARTELNGLAQRVRTLSKHLNGV